MLTHPSQGEDADLSIHLHFMLSQKPLISNSINPYSCLLRLGVMTSKLVTLSKCVNLLHVILNETITGVKSEHGGPHDLTLNSWFPSVWRMTQYYDSGLIYYRSGSLWLDFMFLHSWGPQIFSSVRENLFYHELQLFQWHLLCKAGNLSKEGRENFKTLSRSLTNETMNFGSNSEFLTCSGFKRMFWTNH